MQRKNELKKITNLRFLVAEKEAFHRHWLVTMLETLGARHVIEAADGNAALALLKDPKNSIDIMLMEIDLPGMDGLELIRHIAKDDDNCAVIVVSGLDQALLFSVDTMSKAYGIELLGTLQKPVAPESLLPMIERFCINESQSKTYSTLPPITLVDLQTGLANDEFLPLFQPKIDLATRQVVGVEAFARWAHPSAGLLSPGTFIPLLEAERAMTQLTWIIIEKSVAACRDWKTQGFSLTVSVNISPSVLRQSGLAEEIINYLHEHDLPPGALIFEVTEAATVVDGPYLLENLNRLRMHGFGVSVDDYGTGGSSMQQLMRIPFSEMKIDRTFVSGASQNHALELVLSSSLALCHRLERRSVAVGVETRKDLDFLVKLGCTFAQGFYIAKPMEGSALPIWMREWALFF